MKVLIFLISKVNHLTNQQLQIQQHLFITSSFRRLGRVLLLCTDKVAPDHHAILIISKTLIRAIGGIEQERETAHIILCQFHQEYHRMARIIHTDPE